MRNMCGRTCVRFKVADPFFITTPFLKLRKIYLCTTHFHFLIDDDMSSLMYIKLNQMSVAKLTTRIRLTTYYGAITIDNENQAFLVL